MSVALNPSSSEASDGETEFALDLDLMVLGLIAANVAGGAPSPAMAHWGAEVKTRAVVDAKGDQYTCSCTTQKGVPGVVLTIRERAYGKNPETKTLFFPFDAVRRTLVTLRGRRIA